MVDNTMQGRNKKYRVQNTHMQGHMICAVETVYLRVLVWCVLVECII